MFSVSLDGGQAYEELRGDLGIRLPLADGKGHLALCGQV
jgi:hypothetical protein